MVQEATETQERQSLEAFFGDYDEKFREALGRPPKFLLRKVVDSSRTGVTEPAEVHDDFLPLLPLTKARTAAGLERILRDRTNDTILEELWCLGFSESMGGFVVRSIDTQKIEKPKEIRRFEQWNEEDWKVIAGLSLDKLKQVFDAHIVLMNVSLELAQEAVENNPKYNDPSRWNLLGD